MGHFLDKLRKGQITVDQYRLACEELSMGRTKAIENSIFETNENFMKWFEEKQRVTFDELQQEEDRLKNSF